MDILNVFTAGFSFGFLSAAGLIVLLPRKKRN